MRLSLSLVAVVCALGMGCEPELGGICDPDENKVLTRVRVAAGINDLVRDVAFDNCDEALCASIDGSRPFCTKSCETDLECAEAGEGFVCQQIVQFGELACLDYTPPDQCPADGTPPSDCITADGSPSTNVLKYCSASPSAIAARDELYGREPFVAPTP
ncbi:MAG TPA: hypothetical protein VGF99_17660 [Myxococcota bacterium]